MKKPVNHSASDSCISERILIFGNGLGKSLIGKFLSEKFNLILFDGVCIKDKRLMFNAHVVSHTTCGVFISREDLSQFTPFSKVSK